jgi:hypothetical protein
MSMQRFEEISYQDDSHKLIKGVAAIQAILKSEQQQYLLVREKTFPSRCNAWYLYYLGDDGALIKMNVNNVDRAPLFS